MKHVFKQGCLISLLALSLLACSSMDSVEYEQKHSDESVLLAKAKIALDKKQFYDSTQYLRALDSRFPFSPQQAWVQKMMVYALYASDQLPQAGLEADAYLATHAFDKDADYVFYLRGLIAFEQNKSWLRSTLGYDDSSRDMSAMRLAYDQFTLLTQRFPNSVYAKDAKLRATYIRNLLAKSEWQIARYYYEKHAFHAALNRLENLMRYYPETIYVAKAQALKTKISRYYHLS